MPATQKILCISVRQDETHLSISSFRCVCNVLQPGAKPQAGGRFGFGSPSQPDVHIEMSDMHKGGNGYYDETEENKAFQMEWEQRKAKQDEDLDVIEQGLGNLQNIAQDMGAEINKQDVLLDEIDTQVWHPAAIGRIVCGTEALNGAAVGLRYVRCMCVCGEGLNMPCRWTRPASLLRQTMRSWLGCSREWRQRETSASTLPS